MCHFPSSVYFGEIVLERPLALTEATGPQKLTEATGHQLEIQQISKKARKMLFDQYSLQKRVPCPFCCETKIIKSKT